eukprot:scaffold5778_cov100-Phaeocystis_antarctica.AAC.3
MPLVKRSPSTNSPTSAFAEGLCQRRPWSTSGVIAGVTYVRPISSSRLSSGTTVSTTRCSQSLTPRPASRVKRSEPHRSCQAPANQRRCSFALGASRCRLGSSAGWGRPRTDDERCMASRFRLVVHLHSKHRVVAATPPSTRLRAHRRVLRRKPHARGAYCGIIEERAAAPRVVLHVEMNVLLGLTRLQINRHHDFIKYPCEQGLLGIRRGVPWRGVGEGRGSGLRKLPASRRCTTGRRHNPLSTDDKVECFSHVANHRHGELRVRVGTAARGGRGSAGAVGETEDEAALCRKPRTTEPQHRRQRLHVHLLEFTLVQQRRLNVAAH